MSDAALLAGAVAVAFGARAAWWAIGAVVAGALVLVVRAIDPGTRRWAMVVVVALGALGGLRGATEHARLQPHPEGDWSGWATVVAEPRTHGEAVRAIVRLDGRRYESWVRDEPEEPDESARRAVADRSGAPLAEVVRAWRGGDVVHLTGRRRALGRERAERVAWQHVVGRFDIDRIGPRGRPGRLARLSNTVRAAVERGSTHLPGADAALFRGFVIGDRRGQPEAMVERFRASGLSHLTVVSGLNVALLLAAARPVLVRARPWARWALTVLLVAWFASLTRFEPSILRAGVMAALAATAFVLGRDGAPARLLAGAVVVLVLVDPLLVHAVGFWLSVGATAGVCVVGPRLAERLRPLGPLATPVGITVGAQVGVALPLWVWFGGVPLTSVPANLVAVPVASLVKVYGLPASVVAGAVPGIGPVLMAPCRLGVRFVDRVAALAAAHEPSGVAALVGWGALAVALGAVAAMNRRRDGHPPAHR